MDVAEFAQWVARVLGITREYQGLGPLWGALIGAIITSAVVGGVVHSRTTRHQEASALFEFGKRFHDLMDRAHALAKDYAPGPDGPSALDRAEAGAYYRKFFDLMLNEYNFFRKGLVSPAAFEDWMMWRWGAWHELEGAAIVVRGVPYQAAWTEWSRRPLMRASPFVALIDQVHAAPDLKAVGRLVRRAAPRWWRP
jgi:hypothetical protein